ncbi:hypothetical protein EDB69_3207 [Vibrio crassostreae]|uniref:hypothetical protein n=1 Tax=Vibrio crassostreae TaxID=246167 RepID=UPI000F461D57|nr:hypothetical protein [Vibrio crassostreae]ROO70422.1 hypothetical protein EDB64_2927 [Vibrio crassostreae]ROP08649.1 hypothetical protein EDB63_2653 [Vibrio crassostreae]RPE91447.1 hypothetical protein EDB68_2656 [Vibrio crassostreae]RPF14718.1 hypothetical protein EDB69_3207 [Vibrio crassostreae]
MTVNKLLPKLFNGGSKSLATTYDLTLQMGLTVAPSVLLDTLLPISARQGADGFEQTTLGSFVLGQVNAESLLNELGNEVTVAKSISDTLLAATFSPVMTTAGKALFEHIEAEWLAEQQLVREREAERVAEAEEQQRQQAAALHERNVQTATDALTNPELVSLIELAWLMGGKATSEHDRTERIVDAVRKATRELEYTTRAERTANPDGFGNAGSVSNSVGFNVKGLYRPTYDEWMTRGCAEQTLALLPEALVEAWINQ